MASSSCTTRRRTLLLPVCKGSSSAAWAWRARRYLGDLQSCCTLPGADDESAAAIEGWRRTNLCESWAHAAGRGYLATWQVSSEDGRVWRLAAQSDGGANAEAGQRRARSVV
jgi:hypothetical protein